MSDPRSKAFDYISGGVILLAMAVLMAGHAVYIGLRDDKDIWAHFRQMSGSTLFVMFALAALGLFVLVLGLRMARK